MVSPDGGTIVASLAVVVLGGAAAAVVYRDGLGVGVSRPRLLAGLVGLTVGAGFAMTLIGPAPPQGALVLAALGPIVYLFERYDAVESATETDPHRLPIDQRPPDANGVTPNDNTDRRAEKSDGGNGEDGQRR